LVKIAVTGHVELSGHTRYTLDCALEGPVIGKICWQPMRRLCTLRERFHDAIIEEMGEGGYQKCFLDTPFASRGGIPGTTARLNAWCGQLSYCINTGDLPPKVVAIILQALEAPKPGKASATGQPDVQVPSGYPEKLVDVGQCPQEVPGPEKVVTIETHIEPLVISPHKPERSHCQTEAWGDPGQTRDGPLTVDDQCFHEDDIIETSSPDSPDTGAVPGACEQPECESSATPKAEQLYELARDLRKTHSPGVHDTEINSAGGDDSSEF
jgi:hypothetical protein